MKIDATDPLVMNKIPSKVRGQEVQTLEVSEPSSKVSDEARPEIKLPLSPGKSHLQELETAVIQANETVNALDLGIRFKLHEKTGRYMVQIIDRIENKVIKEIPPERVLNLVGQIREMVGMLLDEKR